MKDGQGAGGAATLEWRIADILDRAAGLGPFDAARIEADAGTLCNAFRERHAAAALVRAWTAGYGPFIDSAVADIDAAWRMPRSHGRTIAGDLARDAVVAACLDERFGPSDTTWVAARHFYRITRGPVERVA